MRTILQNVLIKPITQEKTESGLIIPDSAQPELSKGTVLSVGGKVEEVKVGNTLYWKKGHGIETGGNILIAETLIQGVD